jgi:hypothetical protein
VRQLRKLLMPLGILILMLFSGCTTRTVYVDRPFEVKVEVPCKVDRVKCKTSGSDAEVVLGLATCVVDLKQAASVCR